MTSVLFGDLVGFTPLSESLDSEEVRELLSRYFAQCRTIIGRYGGVVEKFIGDAVMAVWGVPVAHEDDAERAVRAGLELVAAIAGLGQDVGAPGLAIRVGVVTGEVAVTVGATAEGMVAGDAVNTAARVQGVAEPGSVWVDQRTRSLSVAAISFVDAGEHPLKGKRDPVRLWRAGSVVAEVGGGQRIDGLEAPLTGRARELRLVKELFHATQESQRPRLVIVDGEAGVGKSRLGWEFEKYVDGLSSTVRWHRGRCLSYGDGVAFWALTEAVRGRLGLVEADTGVVVGEHLDLCLAEFVPDAEERDWLRPRLAALIGPATPTEGLAREDLFSAWSTFLERTGEGGNAVVLVIEDAQNADDGLLDFVDYLLATARAGVFVLVLTRPELLARRLDLGGRRASVIRLDPLDDTAMGALVDGLVVGLPTRARAALVTRAEGVPLFAVETVRALIDRDAVVPREGSYVLADGVEVDLEAVSAPASLHALVAARLDALTPDERAVVTDACVLGVSFTRDSLAAIGSRADRGEGVDLDGALASLQRKEIISVQTDRLSAERGQFRFVQSVVRQVAYATQSKRDRKARHLAAAEYLASLVDSTEDLAVIVAQHLLDAVEASTTLDTDTGPLTTRACDLLEHGAVRARALGSPAEAQHLLESVLDRTQNPADQARLHVSAAQAACDAGHYETAITHAQEATQWFDKHHQPVQAGLAVAAHAYVLRLLQNNAGAIALAEPRWRALQHVPGAEKALLSLAVTLVSAHNYRGELEAAVSYSEPLILLAESTSDADALTRVYVALGIRYMAIGAPITATGQYELAARLARHHDLLGRLAGALGNLAVLQLSRDLAAALTNAAESVQAARRSGVLASIDSATITYLLALWVAGRLVEAKTLLAAAQEAVADPGIRILLTALQGWLANAFGHQLPAIPTRTETDNESDLAWLDNLDLMGALADGDPRRAARIARGSMAHLLAACGIEDDFIHLWPPLVEAALADGDTELAEQLLQPVATAASGIVSPAVAAQHHRLRGLLGAARGDNPAEVEAHLRAGVEALAAFGAVGLRARAEDELGRWLTTQLRADEANVLLDQAGATYQHIGAHGWLTGLNTWRGSPVQPALTVRN